MTTSTGPGEPRDRYERWLLGLKPLPDRHRWARPGDALTRTAHTWKAATTLARRLTTKRNR